MSSFREGLKERKEELRRFCEEMPSSSEGLQKLREELLRLCEDMSIFEEGRQKLYVMLPRSREAMLIFLEGLRKVDEVLLKNLLAAASVTVPTEGDAPAHTADSEKPSLPDDVK
ncbi:MAG: hypothetical protein AUJ92_07150 [Armatimonadetes bacterium CG2_30_59_28]|nr:hypothetical protein [Armatimonadota bacterium]OIO95949.1 MAG: hypothetical protein AUJ92_07150 [Armatimonadetes bacterium CG2_30_59_28]PIU63064.1 MAG: hypothetical protein COS85_16825 [Armatimonadetes bacterium CG07_land_8_20_14_0_80_59_28]